MDILIVEDEAEIAELIQLYLSKEGFNCHICRDGNTALERFKAIQPDLIVLDLMLPGLDGLEVCARIRQQTVRQTGIKDPYIMMLTAKGEEIDRIIGLSTGADDYMVKPFSPRELVARVRAVLRRSLRQGAEPTATRTYQTAHFVLDIDQRTARQKESRQQNVDSKGLKEKLIRDEHAEEGTQPKGKKYGAKDITSKDHNSPQIPGQNHNPDNPSDDARSLELTPLEFDLLATFMSYPGRVWNRAQLIEKLWGNDFFGDERVVDAHIARLRKKIEPNPSEPSFVKTVVGVGYRFEDETA
ncbi:MAG: response regulator [Phormidesmis sp.]